MAFALVTADLLYHTFIYLYIKFIYTIDCDKSITMSHPPRDREGSFVHVGGVFMTRELLVFTALMRNPGVKWQRTGVLD